jgi:hypothetical protein
MDRSTNLKLAVLRADALQNFYRAERRAGATPLEANERMHFYALRLDALYDQQVEAVRTEMEQAS